MCPLQSSAHLPRTVSRSLVASSRCQAVEPASLGRSPSVSLCLLVWLHHNNHSHGRVSFQSGWFLPDWASVSGEKQILCKDFPHQLFGPQDLTAILGRIRVLVDNNKEYALSVVNYLNLKQKKKLHLNQCSHSLQLWLEAVLQSAARGRRACALKPQSTGSHRK